MERSLSNTAQKAKLWIAQQPIKASLVAGIAFGCSFPPFPFPFPLLILVALTIWLNVIKQATSLQQAITHLFYGLLPANLIVSYWLMMATLGGGIAAIIAKACVMALALIPFSIFVRRWPENHPLWMPSLITAWVFAEGIDFYWDLSYPWLLLGNAWANQPWAYQYVSYTGVLGLSAWLVWTSLAFRNYIFHVGEKRTNKRFVFLLSLLLPLLLSTSLWVYRSQFSPIEDQNDQIRVLLIQPNHDSYAPYNGYTNYQESLDALIDLTEEHLESNPDVIYWPENALDPFITNQGANIYERQVQRAVNRWNTPLISGLTYREYYQPAIDSLPPIVRERESGRPWQVFNAAAGFFPYQPKQVYKKMRLVPLVEKLPFEKQLVATNLLGINWEEWTLFGRGKQLNHYKLATQNNDTTLAPALICYDSVYPELITSDFSRQAGFLAVITNDGWWGRSSGHIQHFALSRLRAVESGKYLVRAANNGISGIITPWGQAQQATEYWTKTAVSAEVPIINTQSFFSRWGTWFFYLCSIFCLSWLGYCYTYKPK